MSLLPALVLLLWAPLAPGLRLISGPPLSCAQKGLDCVVTTSNCMDRGWLTPHNYTPTPPEDLKVCVETRQDEAGHLQPVLMVNWTLRDDGGIFHLKATEVQVLVQDTNENLCVRYSFKNTLPQQNPAGEKWSFSAGMLVVDPGYSYLISVSNIPKPELGHSNYDVSHKVTVPDCSDPTMRTTQYCIERGSLWRPNISVSQITADSGRSALSVSFRPDSLCEEYVVIVSCSGTQHFIHTRKTEGTTLNVTFTLDKWPRHCCQFKTAIKPLFPQCGQDCTRRERPLDICSGVLAVAPEKPQHTFVALGVVLVCVVMAVIMCVLCRKPGKLGVDQAVDLDRKPFQQQQQLIQPPTVLVIYSQDHHLYRDIVLKLCAFLQAKCGTKVLLDLLDSTSVGMVGRLRWLEWQRQQLKNPFDKILVLCSQGVQAKWKAMCGQGRVLLREDVLSPTDDMLTPFLNLFLPDMHQAGMLGKYMVAYFDDISSEEDVPSVFDIGVKYKLMKHFEELYFRILDKEKYQPGQVNHIEGINGDEYFNCPSGRALKNAIETFQAYQLENPDWFKRECVESEEDVMSETLMLDHQLQIPPVLECVPLIREGPPVYIRDVEVNENGNSVHVLTPELNTDCMLPSVVEIEPVVEPEGNHNHPSDPEEVLTDHPYLQSPSPESLYIAEPVLNRPPLPRQNWLFTEEEPFHRGIPTEDEEEDSRLPMSQFSIYLDHRNLALQESLDSNTPEFPSASMQEEYPPQISQSQPVEMEEYEVLQPSGKGQSSGSDQGYISEMSSQDDPPFEGDPLLPLRRLQEEQFHRNLRYADIRAEGN